ncbi:MAG TPA: hypothetical protein GXX75_20915 [Clostridiales bacterium]|nr:hypothetical protein [Clostridiales bacterium]
MKHLDTEKQPEFHITDDLASNENISPILGAWSNLTSRGSHPTKTLLPVPKTHASGMHHFTVSAQKLLHKGSRRHTYTMIIFDVTLLGGASEACNLYVFRDLVAYVDTVLKKYIAKPDLFCQMNHNTFAILVENYKSVDIALLAISLMEEANQFDPGLKVKLTFGTCLSNQPDIDITALYRQAFYAKSTIKDQNHHILADYNELESNKKAATSPET